MIRRLIATLISAFITFNAIAIPEYLSSTPDMFFKNNSGVQQLSLSIPNNYMLTICPSSRIWRIDRTFCASLLSTLSAYYERIWGVYNGFSIKKLDNQQHLYKDYKPTSLSDAIRTWQDNQGTSQGHAVILPSLDIGSSAFPYPLWCSLYDRTITTNIFNLYLVRIAQTNTTQKLVLSTLEKLIKYGTYYGSSSSILDKYGMLNDIFKSSTMDWYTREQFDQFKVYTHFLMYFPTYTCCSNDYLVSMPQGGSNLSDYNRLFYSICNGWCNPSAYNDNGQKAGVLKLFQTPAKVVNAESVPDERTIEFNEILNREGILTNCLITLSNNVYDTSKRLRINKLHAISHVIGSIDTINDDYYNGYLPYTLQYDSMELDNVGTTTIIVTNFYSFYYDYGNDSYTAVPDLLNIVHLNSSSESNIISTLSTYLMIASGKELNASIQLDGGFIEIEGKISAYSLFSLGNLSNDVPYHVRTFEPIEHGIGTFSIDTIESHPTTVYSGGIGMFPANSQFSASVSKNQRVGMTIMNRKYVANDDDRETIPDYLDYNYIKEDVILQTGTAVVDLFKYNLNPIFTPPEWDPTQQRYKDVFDVFYGASTVLENRKRLNVYDDIYTGMCGTYEYCKELFTKHFDVKIDDTTTYIPTIGEVKRMLPSEFVGLHIQETPTPEPASFYFHVDDNMKLWIVDYVTGTYHDTLKIHASIGGGIEHHNYALKEPYSIGGSTLAHVRHKMNWENLRRK